MPITGDMYAFNQQNVDGSPDAHGVYALYDSNQALIYIGRADGVGVTIRSRLQSHLRGDEGRCTQSAAYYRRESTEAARSREVALLEEYKGAHFGRLPSCNERVG
ncbi:MAG: GIY-YIG nuclease family protein [Chloroflexi bacterium]|nr:GIY-YIG nuclease family protein [Chloroflexota bacterium]